MSTHSQFWRDPAVPFIEARGVEDGRKVCYSRHSHQSFSIGAITAGRSTYLNGEGCHQIEAGTVVMMNPGAVHACNPIADQPWSYCMLYVDTPWLAQLQNAQALFQPFTCTHTRQAEIFEGVVSLYAVLTDAWRTAEQKSQAAIAFFTDLHQRLETLAPATSEANHKLERAAAFIREHCTDTLKLEDICRAADLSASYLIRAFRQQYGLTPHGYLIDQRIQFARAQLRRGQLIADVALQAGFADQAHLQRAFKQHLAATPGHYRGQARSR
ncbi:AraC family transcriptional regulator [Pseudomonas sp. R5(2019)]|uniref:AraC family transcriptional regulator n=1 Tax=Pseudomonas sp. R5(2019) TaxID=2697566 RepID=UPI00141234F5|nr:AraC family transcriptional regulator [Pseudomonas sp. R5(2019)]NBA96579.1 helix-turn-helix domain-containing protein [Pseudomonas sp. R5(2019)]